MAAGWAGWGMAAVSVIEPSPIGAPAALVQAKRLLCPGE